MLSQKLLLDVGVDTFTGENHYWWRKSAAHSLIPLASLFSAPRLSRQVQTFI
jgi:hypothetical protein